MMSLFVAMVASFLMISIAVIAWMSHCEDRHEKTQHDTRAYETRIISTLRTPRLDLPIAVEYPTIHEVRNITFRMCDTGANVQRIDVRMLTDADKRALKKINLRFSKHYTKGIQQ